MLRSRNVCGTPGCSCHIDPGKRHGPYWQYTRKINGKTVTRRLTSAEAARYPGGRPEQAPRNESTGRPEHKGPGSGDAGGLTT
ncbi:MAG: DUF6788 family protein [Streptosporangiaceae bacterium]